MELKVDRFLITSDRYQFVLHEMRKPPEETGKTEEFPVNIGYFTDMEQMVFKMLDMGVKGTTASDLQELIEVIRGQRLFVRKASNVIVEAINNLTDRSQLPGREPKPKDLDDLLDEKERKPRKPLVAQDEEPETVEVLSEEPGTPETEQELDKSTTENSTVEEKPTPAKKVGKKKPSETEISAPAEKSATKKKARGLSSLSSKLKKRK
jgi:hypothetical protein